MEDQEATIRGNEELSQQFIDSILDFEMEEIVETENPTPENEEIEDDGPKSMEELAIRISELGVSELERQAETMEICPTLKIVRAEIQRRRRWIQRFKNLDKDSEKAIRNKLKRGDISANEAEMRRFFIEKDAMENRETKRKLTKEVEDGPKKKKNKHPRITAP